MKFYFEAGIHMSLIKIYIIYLSRSLTFDSMHSMYQAQLCTSRNLIYFPQLYLEVNIMFVNVFVYICVCTFVSMLGQDKHVYIN